MTESVIYYNTPMRSVTIQHETESIAGRSLCVTRVFGDRACGKTFTAQAIANYKMLDGAECVLVLDESGEHYYLYAEKGVQGYGRKALPRGFVEKELHRFLCGRRNVHVVIAGLVGV